MKLREDGYINTVGTGIYVVASDDKDVDNVDICFLSAESLVDLMKQWPKKTLMIALMRSLGHSSEVLALMDANGA